MILAISLFTVAVNILMGLLVYIRNPKGLTNRIFLLFAMLVALWALTNYFSLNGKTAEEALLRIRIVLSVVALMFPMLYLFARNFPAPTLQISQTKLWGVVFFSLFIAAFAFTPFVFSKVNIVDGIITPVAAPGILLYALDVVGFPILTFVFLFKEMRRNAGTVKAQLTFLFFGTAISFTLAIVTNFLFVNIFKFTDLVVLGPFFTLILVGCSAYAIIRHRLLDIRLIIARAVSFLTLIFFLAFVYVFVFLIALGWFFNTRVNTPFFVGTLFFTLAAIFTFQPLENLVRRTTDRFLFEAIIILIKFFLN